MSAKIGVAMSKQIGPPERESLEVTCSLEFDDDSPTLQKLVTFQHAVHIAIVACHRALQEDAVRLGVVND